MNKKSKPRETFESILWAVLIALLIRTFGIEAFKIPSSSMVPSLLIGDHLFVNKFVYGLRLPFTKTHFFRFKEPARGDVAVFLYPEDESKDFIKRVVGLPGDRVRTEGENLFVNGEMVPHTPLQVAEDPADSSRLMVKDNAQWSELPRVPHWQDLTFMDEVLGETHHLVQYSPYRSYPDRDYTVPEGHLLVMGDNRDNSADSREWGFLPMGNLKGKAMFIWLSCGEPERPPEPGLETMVESARSTVASIPVIGWILPCDGHWASIRWDRFGNWIH